MVCNPSKVVRKDLGKVNSLYVAYLSAIKNMNKGVGSTLLNFAKKYSTEIGCNGYIHLDSSIRLLPDKLPHTFYRKMGMSSADPKIDSILDLCLKSGEYPQQGDLPILRMYYPPIQFSNKIPLYKRLISSLKNLLQK